VELIVVPMAAADYYGPNAGLRAALQAGANTWRPVHREARGNCLTVRAAQGTVLRRYPVTVRVAADETADLTVTGGIGSVPVTFVGLRGHRTYALDIEANGRRARFDQSVHGNDYWQTDYDPAARTWRVTYGIPLDTAGDAPRTVRLYFARRNASAK